MVKQPLYEQLDEAIRELLSGAGTARPSADRRLAFLLQIAGELRHLPRRNFKQQLKSDLQRRISMSTVTDKEMATTTAPQYHTITPYLVVQDVPALIEFLKQAFGAEQIVQAIGGEGGIHAEVRVGDSILMIGGGSPQLSWRGESMPQSLHLYVPDADAVYKRALQAGATSTHEPVDQFYGDREAGVKDNAGNIWWIATHKEGGYIPRGLHTVTPFLHPLKADPFIAFLQRAFGAEQVHREAAPDGAVQYASVRIGDSTIEMGEAHGEHQPRPSMFLLNVADVDTAYRQALEAGATSIEEPADQPYGHRRAAVQDAFGNQWYVSAPIRKP